MVPSSDRVYNETDMYSGVPRVCTGCLLGRVVGRHRDCWPACRQGGSVYTPSSLTRGSRKNSVNPLLPHPREQEEQCYSLSLHPREQEEQCYSLLFPPAGAGRTVLFSSSPPPAGAGRTVLILPFFPPAGAGRTVLILLLSTRGSRKNSGVLNVFSSTRGSRKNSVE